MKSEIVISIILPVYNVGPYLRECLDSILTQSFSQYEVICVYDVSQDDSLAILREYEQKNEKVKIISRTVSKGLSGARNMGIKAAQGKYILFIDSDDMLAHKNALREMYAMAENYDTEMVHFSYEKRKDEEMQHPLQIKENEAEMVEDTGKEMFCRMMEARMVGVEAWRVLYKREFLERNQLEFIENLYHEDILFFFRCIMVVKRIVWTNDIHYLYRQRENSLSRQALEKRVNSLFYILSQMYVYWVSNEFTERENEAIRYYFWVAYWQYEQYQKWQVEEKEMAYFGTYAEQYVYGLLAKKQEVHFTGKQIAEIVNAPKVIVYGAGIVALSAISKLKNLEVDIWRVAVTSKKKNPEILLDIKVSEIAELKDYCQETLVLLAVKEKFVEEIKTYVGELGFRNVMVLEW